MKNIIFILLSFASCASPTMHNSDVEAKVPEIGAIVQPIGVSLAVVQSPQAASLVTEKNFLVLERLGDVSIVRSPESVIVTDIMVDTVTKTTSNNYSYRVSTLRAVSIKNIDGSQIGWVPAWNLVY